MTGIICSVAVCRSNSKKASDAGEKISFFQFPKDPKIRKEWIQNCYRQDKFDPKNKRVCDKHFKEDDYEDGLRARLLNTRPRILKATGKLTMFTCMFSE